MCAHIPIIRERIDCHTYNVFLFSYPYIFDELALDIFKNCFEKHEIAARDPIPSKNRRQPRTDLTPIHKRISI